jgi:hypothetical protein
LEVFERGPGRCQGGWNPLLLPAWSPAAWTLTDVDPITGLRMTVTLDLEPLEMTFREVMLRPIPTSCWRNFWHTTAIGSRSLTMARR